jgi:peptidyl-dipeptidase Dcp
MRNARAGDVSGCETIQRSILCLVALCAPLLFSGGTAAREGDPDVAGRPPATAEDPGVNGAEPHNPLLREWKTPYGIPPFDAIRDQHYRAAFTVAIAAQRAEIARIRDNPEPPDFGNTVEALEMAGALLTRVERVFGNITNTDTNDTLNRLDVEIAPELSREHDAIYLDSVLFARVNSVHERRASLGLGAEALRLVELQYRDFVRAGAALDAAARQRLGELNTPIAELSTHFRQNMLKETKAFVLLITDTNELSGLSPQSIAAACAAALDRGHEQGWLFGLDRAVFEDFMSFADNRDLRRRMFEGYRQQGARGGEHDNRAIVLEITRLRAERAALLGFASHAAYKLDTRMAKTPEQAREFLFAVWRPALERAGAELADMQAIADGEGQGFAIAGWDWWYYAEKLRQRKFAVDETQLRPFFELGNVRRGAFHVAGKLFGLRFEPLENVPTWHPAVRAWAVHGRQGAFLGVFMADDHTRDSKRGGAWKSTYRNASDVSGNAIRPIVTNNLNLPPPGAGEPTLLTFDQVETLFHEFGHALHELLTTVRYPRFSGSRGSPRDYVEFPSQFLERYAAESEVLEIYARHYASGAPMPPEWVDRLRGASRHNQGFKTTEFIAAALLDLAWHGLDASGAAAIDDPEAFESRVLDGHGLPPQIGPRYRSTYFAHVFAGGYAAGYYGYLWSETLEADAFAAFQERGDVFDPVLAQRLSEHIYQAGGREEAELLYRNFRGRDPGLGPLLQKRGLSPAPD